MKGSKVLQRLDEVEESPSRVIGRYAANEQNVKVLLEEAKSCVVHARKAINTRPQPAVVNDSPGLP